MRNNLAVLQAISAGNGLRPTGIESVQDLTHLDFQRVENFHYGIFKEAEKELQAQLTGKAGRY
jgi:hypothetical protein